MTIARAQQPVGQIAARGRVLEPIDQIIDRSRARGEWEDRDRDVRLNITIAGAGRDLAGQYAESLCAWARFWEHVETTARDREVLRFDDAFLESLWGQAREGWRWTVAGVHRNAATRSLAEPQYRALTELIAALEPPTVLIRQKSFTINEVAGKAVPRQVVEYEYRVPLSVRPDGADGFVVDLQISRALPQGGRK